jgi:hypothetical protein
MPYYIYRITPPNRLEQIDSYENYRLAKEQIRKLWAKVEPDSEVVIRMIFAETQGEAERLLLLPRDDRIIGDD